MATAASIGMASDYNERSAAMIQMLASAEPYILAATEAHSANVSETSPIVIADFGSSAGATSSASMALIIGFFREKYGHNFEILTVHEDVARNNWSELFRYIHR